MAKYKKGEESRQRIIDAAARLANEKGFSELTIRDICVEADVTIGAFYHHFKSKNELIRYIPLMAPDYFIPVMETIRKGKTCSAQLEIFAYYYGKLNEYTGFDRLKILYDPENHWFTERHRMEIMLLDIITEGQKNGELTEEKDAEFICKYLFTIMRGCCLNWCMYECEYNLSDECISYTKYAVKPFLTEKGDCETDFSWMDNK